MSPTSDAGALIITFPRAWTAAQRLAFMEDVARAVPRERWAHVAERMCTDSIDATATERRAVFARLTARRARGVDQQDGLAPVSWTLQIARKCGRSDPWPSESGGRLRTSSKHGR